MMENDLLTKNVKNNLKSSKLNSELKANWVKALRSGEYIQGNGYLHDIKNNTYCCLGILCEISKIPKFDKSNDKQSFGWIENHSFSDLPSSFRATINMTVNTEAALILLNDHGNSFAQIADVIEEYL